VWQDVNDGFFRCPAWRSVAENASRTLKKGMRVFVAGKLVQRTWQDESGNKRQTVEIQVTHLGPDFSVRLRRGDQVHRRRPDSDGRVIDPRKRATIGARLRPGSGAQD
jgi:single-strand DNA-binding protein